MTENTLKYLITGGAGGIGLALAKALCRAGHTVIVCGRDMARLQRAQNEVPALITRQCDIANASDRLALVTWIKAEHPDLNVLINNAAMQTKLSLLGAVDEALVQQELNTNVTAPLMLSLDLLPVLTSQEEDGVIINLSSGLAFCPVASLPVYSASKAALHSLTLSMRHQFASQRVKVLEVIAPPVATSLGGNAALDAADVGIPLMQPDEFAAELLREMSGGQEEIAIGMASASRAQGEALFGLMNP
ncbi:SDR family NAD(P)-dependent oxidoreductase [Devosia sp. LjRoot3]|uniref:SDR family NAD(P)-dependent oxidoreductase n=1 Tax=Devosia sp. LjRoot3 TaxID=3342319 RepID=UPI003ECFAD28